MAPKPKSFSEEISNCFFGVLVIFILSIPLLLLIGAVAADFHYPPGQRPGHLQIGILATLLFAEIVTLTVVFLVIRKRDKATLARKQAMTKSSFTPLDSTISQAPKQLNRQVVEEAGGYSLWLSAQERQREQARLIDENRLLDKQRERMRAEASAQREEHARHVREEQERAEQRQRDRAASRERELAEDDAWWRERAERAQARWEYAQRFGDEEDIRLAQIALREVFKIWQNKHPADLAESINRETLMDKAPPAWIAGPKASLGASIWRRMVHWNTVEGESLVCRIKLLALCQKSGWPTDWGNTPIR